VNGALGPSRRGPPAHNRSGVEEKIAVVKGVAGVDVRKREDGRHRRSSYAYRPSVVGQCQIGAGHVCPRRRAGRFLFSCAEVDDRILAAVAAQR